MAGEINFGILDSRIPERIANSYFDGQQRQQQNALMAAQLQGAQRQNKLADLAMADDEATRNAYRASGGDMSKAMTALQQGGQYKQAMELQGKISAQQKEALATKKAEIENHLKTFEVVGQIMSGVSDQASYDAARQQLAQIVGPEVAAKTPAVYDPSVVEQGRLKAMSVKDQMANQWKSIDAQLNQDKFQYQQRNDADNRNVTIRGQNISASNAAAGRAQSERHFQVTNGQGKVPAGYRELPDGSYMAIPGGPADVKAQALAGQKAAGASDVDAAVATLRNAYDRLETGGGITSTKNGVLGNLAASSSSSGVGQAVGRALGTNNQSARNDIAMTRPALLAALMKATGMSAKQMDSNAELKLWMATATDPTLDVEANRRALDAIERKYLAGSAPANPAAKASGKPSVSNW